MTPIIVAGVRGSGMWLSATLINKLLTEPRTITFYPSTADNVIALKYVELAKDSFLKSTADKRGSEAIVIPFRNPLLSFITQLFRREHSWANYLSKGYSIETKKKLVLSHLEKYKKLGALSHHDCMLLPWDRTDSADFKAQLTRVLGDYLKRHKVDVLANTSIEQWPVINSTLDAFTHGDLGIKNEVLESFVQVSKSNAVSLDCNLFTKIKDDILNKGSTATFESYFPIESSVFFKDENFKHSLRMIGYKIIW